MNVPGVDKNEIEEGAEEVCRYESLQQRRYRQNEPNASRKLIINTKIGERMVMQNGTYDFPGA